MFNTLLEAIDPDFIRLTDIQKSVLLTAFVSETPGVAYEATSGDIYITYARDFLVRAGLLSVSSNEAATTGNGYEVLISNGLIEQGTDQPTERGIELLAWFEREKRQLQESKIPYRTIKSVL